MKKIVCIKPAVTSMPTLEEQYEKYLAWCKALLVKPADYETWIQVSKRVGVVLERLN